MSPLSEEVMLMMLVVGLYVYDSALLLYPNEGLLVHGAAGWRVRFGLREPRLRGREFLLPAPWHLHSPHYRLAWSYTGEPTPGRTGEAEYPARAPMPLALLLWAVAIALFALLPASLFLPLGERTMVGALLLPYALIAATLAYVAFRRKALHLESRFVGKLALECLLCPPFALNIVQKISNRAAHAEDLVRAARRLQGAVQWERTRQQLMARLDEEIEMEHEEGSRRMAQLRLRRAAIAQ